MRPGAPPRTEVPDPVPPRGVTSKSHIWLDGAPVDSLVNVTWSDGPQPEHVGAANPVTSCDLLQHEARIGWEVGARPG